jgi:DNA-binding LacI/PurR family transcriptional regulator
VAARLRLASPPRLPVPRERASATAAVRGLRAAQPGVTAIAAHDDDVALRVLAAAADLGIAVPGDLAVIGHDETEYGALPPSACASLGHDHFQRR